MSQADENPITNPNPRQRGRRHIDLTGKRFSRWIVVERAETEERYGASWRVKCDCGAEKVVLGQNLLNGRSKSCGCWNLERSRRSLTKHGVSRAPEYNVWRNMIRRCTDPKCLGYPRYGALGITVCERWQNSVAAFCADMGPRPSPAHQIDRKDSSGNYEPGNCRWATTKEQARNRRNNRIITIGGVKLSVAEAAERYGVDYNALYNRLRLGWSPEAALGLIKK